jgi:ribonucleoside-diphosphate reductase alpha chain
MKVKKRNGDLEDVDFNKITTRIQKLAKEISAQSVDPILIAQKVCAAIHENVKTTDLDTLASEIAMSMSTIHHEYGTLAGYIVCSDMHKQTNSTFSEVSRKLFENGFLSKESFDITMKYKDILETTIIYSKDYYFDYFGLKTLQKTYLQKIEGNIIERPQDMFMRVSIGIHGDDIDSIVETYNFLSEKYFIHATPTLFNSGSVKPQLASCFLAAMQDDSIQGIYETLKECALISKWAGGIGLHIHNIRSMGSSIRKSKGACTGIIPMLKVFNDTAKYVNQEGKRPGSIAIYLQVDHPDIFDFLDLRKNSGDEEVRARDLFYAVWIPDLFMKKAKSNDHEYRKWHLFCPHDCPGLADVYGEAYENLYETYVKEGKAKKIVDAQDLFVAILIAQIETGTPYILYKDAINKKSNQKNVGTIKSSNLCCEIVEYSDANETAVCNLASICLPRFIEDDEFNYDQLHKVSYTVTKNLNKIIDRSFYPIEKAKVSNLRHRPIGIGVQGLADVYIKLRLPFDSDGAKLVNRKIFETIYHGAMTASIDLAKIHGPYETYEGSPLSQGLFQFDLWDNGRNMLTGLYDWVALKTEVLQYGVRNSLLIAPMPTASTSQILGNNESFEPYTSNLYTRRGKQI